MKRTIKIEEEFNRFVSLAGGKKVSELIGLNPTFDNADYIFNSDEILVELKCLEDNKLNDKAINEKILRLYGKWKAEGYNISLVNNEWRATVSNLPKELSLQILKIYAKPIRKRIIKANKQIKGTKKALQCEHYKGVLLLANDGNLALDPEHIYAILNYVLGTSYSGINAVVFFTVNQVAKASFTNADTLVWANLNRQGFEPVSEEFFDKLSNGWLEHMGDILGYLPQGIDLKKEKNLSKLVNINKDITCHCS
jgi:hypothetical protein